MDRDDSFRSVLALIRNFHSMEEPAGVPSARCKTSLASIYGLMSKTSPAFHLPTSPLLRSLLDDTNLALSKCLEDQTVHGFLPVLSHRHQRYYRTSSSSFPGPYSVPPGVTSITLEKASEARKRSVSLSASQVSSMETMLPGVCEVASWLDWWLSTCGSFRENLPVEVRADFKRLIFSGSRVLEFLASRGCTALGNLVLSRQDSLLADVHSTVPAEEVARALEVLASSRDGVPLFVSSAGLSIDQDAGGCQRRSCATYPSSAQDSLETCGCWRVSWVVIDWFCAGELLWCSSCSEAVLDFFPFWPVWQEEEEPQGKGSLFLFLWRLRPLWRER